MRASKSPLHILSYIYNYMLLISLTCLFVQEGRTSSCKCRPPTKVDGIFDSCNFHLDNLLQSQNRWSNCSTHQLPENGTFYMDANHSYWEVFCGYELNEFYDNSECDLNKLYECKYDSIGQIIQSRYSDVGSQCFATERCIPGNKWTTRRCSSSLKKCMCPMLPLDKTGRVSGFSRKLFCGHELENLAINKHGLCENHGLYSCNYGHAQDGSVGQRKTSSDCAYMGLNCTRHIDPSRNETRICQHPDKQKDSMMNEKCTCPETWLQRIPRNESLGQIEVNHVFYVSYCGFELNQYFKNDACKVNHIISCFQYEYSNWTTQASVSAECVNECQIDPLSRHNRGRKCSI